MTTTKRYPRKKHLVGTICKCPPWLACLIYLFVLNAMAAAASPHGEVGYNVYQIHMRHLSGSTQFTETLRKGAMPGSQIVSITPNKNNGATVTLLHPAISNRDELDYWTEKLGVIGAPKHLTTIYDPSIAVFRSELPYHKLNPKTRLAQLQQLAKSVSKGLNANEVVAFPAYVRNPINGATSLLILTGEGNVPMLPTQIGKHFFRADPSNPRSALRLGINDQAHPAARYSVDGIDNVETTQASLATAFNALATQQSQRRRQTREHRAPAEWQQLYPAGGEGLLYIGDSTQDHPEIPLYLINMLGLRSVVDDFLTYEGSPYGTERSIQASRGGGKQRSFLIHPIGKKQQVGRTFDWLKKRVWPLAEQFGGKVHFSTLNSKPIDELVEANLDNLIELASMDPKDSASQDLLQNTTALDSGIRDFPLTPQISIDAKTLPDTDGLLALRQAATERGLKLEEIWEPNDDTPAADITPYFTLDPATAMWAGHFITFMEEWMKINRTDASLADKMQRGIENGTLTLENFPPQLLNSPFVGGMISGDQPVTSFEPGSMPQLLTYLAEAIGVVTASMKSSPQQLFPNVRRVWGKIPFSEKISGAPTLAYMRRTQTETEASAQNKAGTSGRDNSADTGGNPERPAAPIKENPSGQPDAGQLAGLSNADSAPDAPVFFSDLPPTLLNHIFHDRRNLDFVRPSGKTAAQFEDHITTYIERMETLKQAAEDWISQHSVNSPTHIAVNKLLKITDTGLGEANTQLALLWANEGDLARLKEIDALVNTLQEKSRSPSFRLTKGLEEKLLAAMKTLRELTAMDAPSADAAQRTKSTFQQRLTESTGDGNADIIVARVGNGVTKQWTDTRLHELSKLTTELWQLTPKSTVSTHSYDTLMTQFVMEIAAVLTGARYVKFLKPGITAPQLPNVSHDATRIVAGAHKLTPIIDVVKSEHSTLSASSSGILQSASAVDGKDAAEGGDATTIVTHYVVSNAASLTFEKVVADTNAALSDDSSDISKLFNSHHENQRVFLVPKVTKAEDGTLRYQLIVERFATNGRLLGHEDDARDLHLGSFFWENARSGAPRSVTTGITNVPKIAQYVTTLNAMKKDGASSEEFASMRLERRHDSSAPKITEDTIADLERAVNELIEEPSSSGYGQRLGELVSVDALAGYRITFSLETNPNSKSKNPSQFLMPRLVKVTKQ